MGQLILAFWSVARLRLSPQDLPCSPMLLLLTLGMHWATGFAISLVTLPFGTALGSAFAGTLIMAALVHGILSVRRLAGRTIQTLIALAGAEILIGLAALPVSFWYFSVAEGEQALPVVLSLLILGWNIAVAGHVFRHALDTRPGTGFLIGLAYLFASLLIADLLIPPVN